LTCTSAISGRPGSRALRASDRVGSRELPTAPVATVEATTVEATTVEATTKRGTLTALHALSGLRVLATLTSMCAGRAASNPAAR
jgi:hypothetical protein